MMSRMRCVWSVTKASRAPLAPAGTAQDEFFEFLLSGADVKYADLKAKAELRAANLQPVATMSEPKPITRPSPIPTQLEQLFKAHDAVMNFTLREIMLDMAQGRTRLPIEACTRINRALYKQIDEKVLFENGDFSLEVSSPGVDEPLKMLRQYKKNIGRKLEVVFTDDSKKEGKLVAVDENGIQLEYTEGKNKKAVIHTKEIAFSDIKQATVLISF